MNVSRETSLITILTSEHGRLRREQRDIDKRDLQKALKYGNMTLAWGRRWKVEYDGITFITDASRRREVTAFPSPLPYFDVDTQAAIDHTKAKQLLDQKPELATSHTVLIIDDSGSMLWKKNDIHLYRDSQNAAFSITALEFIAEQIFNQTAVNSDPVSLIKFNTDATIEIEREPIGWPVYNKILSYRKTETYNDRRLSPFLDGINAMRNYIPALQKAIDLVEKDVNDQCAVSLFFFSDGLPTDAKKMCLSSDEVISRMCSLISSMGQRLQTRLSVAMVGLGNINDDFLPLRRMADAATEEGAKGSFEFCNKTANSISSAISSLFSTTMETKTALHEGSKIKYTMREGLQDDKKAPIKFDWQYFRIIDHFAYDPQTNYETRSSFLPPAATLSNPEYSHQENPPPFLAINKNYIGKGAERVAFRCRLSNTRDVSGFAFDPMIAKETKTVERIHENIDFHREFFRSQDLASYLATQFNKYLHGLPDFKAETTPQIKFLSCSILLVDDPNWPTGLRGVLLEKLLDTNRFPWTKWNDNNGMVNGTWKPVPLDVDFYLQQLEKEKEAGALGAIAEDDEEEESLEDDGEISEASSDDGSCGPPGDESQYLQSASGRIDPDDYLQAFTHFTYRYTGRRVMVCDLQGVFNTDMNPPTFELTDPAIHYRSTVGRRMVYGRTDKGEFGIKNFFGTHKCTKICKVLRLSGKNKKWKRDWYQQSRVNASKANSSPRWDALRPPPQNKTLSQRMRGFIAQPPP